MYPNLDSLIEHPLDHRLLYLEVSDRCNEYIHYLSGVV